MAPIQIHFIYDKGAAPTQAAATALEQKLVSLRPHLMAFSKIRHFDLREPLVFADIFIHLYIPVFTAVPYAHANILIQDTSAWSAEWDPYRPSYDAFIDKDTLDTGIIDGLKAVFDTAISRRPTHGVHHCPPILTVQDCPSISIVTPTYNRRALIEIAFHNLLSTDYPKAKMEWIVVEDHEDSAKMCSDKIIQFQANHPTLQVKYIPIQGRMTIGQKRNIGVENATHDIVLFMDDDDNYPVTSFRRRVAWLTKGPYPCDIAFCTTIALYDLIRGVSAVNVPPYGLSLGKRASEATLTFRKSAWTERKFEDVSVAEAENWIAGRETQCLEIQPQQIIVAFSHSGNSTGRRIPPSDLKEVNCFWGFPKEYLIFIHKLAGIEVEETKKKAAKAKKTG